MRFLLVFYATTTDEWRVLDTATVSTLEVADITGLAAALRREKDLLLRWMLGRYEILEISAPASVGNNLMAGAGGIEIYPLAPEASTVPLDREYRAPWIEILRGAQPPAGFLRVRKAGGILRLLEARSEHPLNVSSDACKQTAGEMAQWHSRKNARDQRLAQARPKTPAEQKDKV